MTRYMSEDLEGVRSHPNGAVSLETRMSSVVVTHVRPHHTLYARCRAASCLDLIAPAPCKHIEPCSFPLCTHGEIRPRRTSPLAPVNSHIPPNPTSFGQQSSRYQHHGARSVEPANGAARAHPRLHDIRSRHVELPQHLQDGRKCHPPHVRPLLLHHPRHLVSQKDYHQ